MRKVGKIFSIVLAIMLIVMMSANVFAVEPSTVLNAMENADTSNTSTKGITNAGAKLIKILQTAGIVVAVIILIVLGIKYMMGSAEEKAEYKKTFIPYLIGAVLIFGASAFAGMIFEFAKGF